MKQLELKNPGFQYVEQSFREWLDVLGYAQSTVYQLPNYVREFFFFLEGEGIKGLGEVGPEHFRRHVEGLKKRGNTRRGGGLSNAYLNKHIQGLEKFAEYLRKSGRLTFPALGLEWAADDTREVETLSQEEILELYRVTEGYNLGTPLEAINARDRAMLTVFYGCGLRRNEGYSLDLSDVNYERGLIHVRKGKNYRERFVPINATGLKHLQTWVYDWRGQLLKEDREAAFFISQRGKRMDTQSMAIRLKILQQRTDNLELKSKNLRLHVLRHSIATHLLENGMPLEKIGRFLGHTSLESTQVYTHLGGRTAAGNEHWSGGAAADNERWTGNKEYPNIPRFDRIQLHEDERG